MSALATDWQMLGSLADWATTVVALAAGFVAYLAFRKTSETNDAQQKTLELQRKQYEDAQRQLERAQAEKVSFWASDDDGIFIANASDLPVHWVDLVTVVNESLEEAVLHRLAVVAPTGVGGQLCVFTARPPDTCNQTMLLRFRDAGGRFWMRDEHGELARESDRFAIEVDDEVADDMERRVDD